MAMITTNATGKIDGSLQVDCFSPLMIKTNGIWMGNIEPLRAALPLFLIQLFLLTVVARIINALLKPLRQPMFLAEVLAGLLLGPTGFARHVIDMSKLFPLRSIPILGSAADLGLVFFAFMVGVELDIKALKQLWRKIGMISVASIVVPFVVTVGVTYLLRRLYHETAQHAAFYIYLAMALSITSFPVLARVLREFSLVNSELGHISVSASALNTMVSWIIVMIMIKFSGFFEAEAGRDLRKAVMPVDYLMLCIVVYVLVCVSVVRPAIVWLLSKTPDGEPMSDVHAGIILMGVPLAGIVADCMSISFVLGALVYGLIIPCTPHGTALIERMEDMASGLFVPIMFAANGLNMDFGEIKNPKHVVAVICTFILSCIVKVASTAATALYYKMPLHESLCLGFLMNTRGYSAAVMVDIAKDRTIVTRETYTVLVASSIVLSTVMVPVIAAIYKPSRRLTANNRRRTLMRLTPGSQLRLVACVHTARNVPSIITFLELAHPTKRSPVSVSALHLVELTGRASAALLAHPTREKKLGGSRTRRHATRFHAQSDHIIAAFETFEQHAGGVSMQAFTSISPYSAMHEDICHVAEDKRADTVVLPFHKVHTVDGDMEVLHPAIRTVNVNVLNHAPCPVIILVDRGLGRVGACGFPYKIAVLFFGGKDDRHALTCAWRMADHPHVCLTVVRFVAAEEAVAAGEKADLAKDEEHVSEFRLRHLDEESVAYAEVVVSNGEDTVAVLRSLCDVHYDLYVVGRSQGRRASRLTAGMTEWSECPELGPVGDLASPDFGMTASVAVVQHCVDDGDDVAEAEARPQSPENKHESKHKWSATAGPPQGSGGSWKEAVGNGNACTVPLEID